MHCTMTTSGSGRRRGPGPALARGLLVLLVLYLLACVAGPVYLLIRYRAVDLAQLEPRPYRSRIERFRYSDGDGVTPFNTYHPHINAFGARNRFEVRPDDDNLVYMLGDSYMFGYGLEDPDTLPHRMNRLDPHHRYINLGLPGTNVVDAVARFRQARARTAPPRAVVLQTLLINDTYASAEIERRVLQQVTEDQWLVLFPVSLLMDREWLFRYYFSRVDREIMTNQLDAARFERYLGRPLTELSRLARADRAPLIVIEYTSTDDYPDYHRRLRALAGRRGFTFVIVDELVRPDDWDLLPDNHPGPGLNRAIARKLVTLVARRLGRPGGAAEQD